MNPRNRNYDAQPRQGMGRTSRDYGRTGRVAYDYRETTDGDSEAPMTRLAAAGSFFAMLLVLCAFYGLYLITGA